MTDVVDRSPPAVRRPWTSSAAAALLALMGLCGLAYAIATLAVTPGVVDRFRGAVAAGSSADGLVTLVWIGAAIGSVLGVILFALYVALAFGLRRGSNGSRIAVWVLCALGFLGGGISLLTVLVQQAGERTPGSEGEALVNAYPGGWIGLNETLAGLQMAGYIAVAVLLIATPRAAFARTARERADAAGPAPYAFGPAGGTAHPAFPTSGSAPYPASTYPASAGTWGQGPAYPYGRPPSALPMPGQPAVGPPAGQPPYGAAAPGQPSFGAGAPGQSSFGAPAGQPSYGAAAPGPPSFGAGAPGQSSFGAPAGQPSYGAVAPGQSSFGAAAPGQPLDGEPGSTSARATSAPPPPDAAVPARATQPAAGGPQAQPPVASSVPLTGYERPASADRGPTPPEMPPPMIHDPHADAADGFWQRPESGSSDNDAGPDTTEPDRTGRPSSSPASSVRDTPSRPDDGAA